MRLWSQYISFGGSMTYLVHTFRLPGGLVLCYSLRMTDRLMSITMMPSSTIINCHQLSIIIINYHQLYHQLSSAIINYHQLYKSAISSTIINYSIINYVTNYIINYHQFSTIISFDAIFGTQIRWRSRAAELSPLRPFVAPHRSSLWKALKMTSHYHHVSPGHFQSSNPSKISNILVSKISDVLACIYL